MADAVDSMTNADLQTKLTEYGFPKVPVTPATRKVLVKKLKAILENEKDPKSLKDTKEHKQLPTRSSTKETSDEIVTTKAKERNVRRKTINPQVVLTTIDAVTETQKDTVKTSINLASSGEGNFQTTINQVDSMTDAELQKKLTELGNPVVPVTAATRGFLRKKLKLALEKQRDEPDTKSKQSIKQATEKNTVSENVIDEQKINSPIKARNKRGRSSIAAEDNIKIATEDTNIRPTKISRLSAPFSASTSSTITSTESMSSTKSTFTSLFGDQTSSISKHTSNTTNNSLLGDTQDTTGSGKYTGLSQSLFSDINKTFDSDRTANKSLFQSLFDRQNIANKRFSTSSLSNTSSVSHKPNITRMSYQPPIPEADDSDSPFLSDFGRRLHAQKLMESRMVNRRVD